MTNKKQSPITAGTLVPPVTLGSAMETCRVNEKKAIENLPYKLRCAFDISLAGTQISFHKDGDYLSHEEAVEAVKLLLSLLTQEAK